MVGVSVGENMPEIVEGIGETCDGGNDVTPEVIESDSGMNAGSAQGYVVSDGDSTDEYGADAAHRIVEAGEGMASPVAVSHLRGWLKSVEGV